MRICYKNSYFYLSFALKCHTSLIFGNSTYTYNVFWCPSLTSPSDPSHVHSHSWALLTAHPLSVFNSTLIPICAVYMFLGMKPSPGPWLTYQDPYPRENWLSFPQKLLTVNSSPARIQDSGVSPCWNIDGLLLCRTCVGNHDFCEFMHMMAPSLPKDPVSSRSSNTSDSHHLSTPFLFSPRS